MGCVLRPPTRSWPTGLDPELQALILEIAKDNPKWGCVRIRGELLKLGHLVSATAIRKLLRRNQIGPAPLRSRLTWERSCEHRLRRLSSPTS